MVYAISNKKTGIYYLRKNQKIEKKENFELFRCLKINLAVIADLETYLLVLVA